MHFMGKYSLPQQQNGFSEISSSCLKASQNSEIGSVVRVARLTVFTSQHPFTKDTADKPLQGEKGSVQATFSPAAPSSCLPHVHRVKHSHIHLSLPAALFLSLSLALINVCVLYPLLFASRQLRHCSDGGGGCVYACV